MHFVQLTKKKNFFVSLNIGILFIYYITTIILVFNEIRLTISSIQCLYYIFK